MADHDPDDIAAGIAAGAGCAGFLILMGIVVAVIFAGVHP